MTTDAVLQPGETEVGDFLAAAPNGSIGATTIQFWPHLPESVQGGHTNVLSSGEHTSECPGVGQAEPGYMCVYEDWNYNMSFEAFISTLPGSVAEGPVSGIMYWQSHNAQGNVRGSWAYTAP